MENNLKDLSEETELKRNDLIINVQEDLFHEDSNPKPSLNNNWILESIEPLTRSMRIFGLYFDYHKARDVKSSSKCRSVLSSFTRIYPILVIVILWLNVLRLVTMFTRDDTVGMSLYWKIIIFSWAAMATFIHTSSFIACKTGKLHKSLAEISEMEGCAVYLRRWAVFLSVSSWSIVIANMVFVVYNFYVSVGRMDLLLAPASTWISLEQVR